MPDPVKIYYLLKLGAFPLACFGGGAWLIYYEVADKKERVTFGDVFPGFAAITAGLLAAGLVYYLRRSSRNDTPAPGAPPPAPDAEPGGGTAPQKPWRAPARPSGAATRVPHTARWFELTPLRRQLLLVAVSAIGVLGCMLLRAKQAVTDSLPPVDASRADPDAEARRLRRQVAVAELGRINRLVNKGEQFAQKVGPAYASPSARDAETRQKLDEAVDASAASLREQGDRLKEMQADDALADRAQVSALRARCMAVIEQLADIRAKNRRGPHDKE